MKLLKTAFGLLLLATACAMLTLTCEKLSTSGGDSDDTDTTANVEIQGNYYGYLTTDYYTMNRRTVSRVHVNVTHATEDRDGCTCIYDIELTDSVATIAFICTSGRSSRLTSNCTDSVYHDVFVGTGNGTAISGIIERYKLQGQSSEIHYSTLSFEAELP